MTYEQGVPAVCVGNLGLNEVVAVPKPALGKLLVDLADSVPYRQNTRVPIVIPITISGQNSDGSAFEEGTQTIDIGKRGIRTSSANRLAADTRVQISDGTLGKALPARVVWQAHPDSPGARADTGIEFLESSVPKNAWADKRLPDDWANGRLRLTPSQKLEFFWQRMNSFPISPELRALVESSKSLPVDIINDLTSSGLNTGAIETSSMAGPVMPAQDKDEPREAQINSGPGVLPPPDSEVKDASEQSPPAASTKDDFTQKARGGTRSAHRVSAQSENRKSASDDLSRWVKTLSQQVDAISKGVDKSLASVRGATEDGIARLRSLREEIESQLAATRTESEQRLAQLAEAKGGEFSLKTDAELSRIRGELQQLEAKMAEISQATAQRGTEGASTQAKDLAIETDASLAGFREELVQALKEFRGAVANEAQDQLRRTSANMKEISATEQKELHVKAAALQQARVDPADWRSASAEKAGAQGRQKPLGFALLLAIFLAIATLICGFAFFSTHPTWQLEAEPPAEFLGAAGSKSLQPGEEDLARAYWGRAVDVIQKTYRFGTSLPAQPPREFAVPPQTVPRIQSKAYLESSRERYWQRLQQVWNDPRVWVETYEWDTDWLFSPLKMLGAKLRG